VGGYAVACQANNSKKISHNRKKISCFSALLWYSLTMKKKYYTTPEIVEYAEQNKAICTFASLSLRVFKGWTAKGSYEVKFHRVEPCVWMKKIVRK
jgi:hypothetical protein